MFNKFKNRQVETAIIGAGHFGTAVVTQQLSTPNVAVHIVADISLENARAAFIKTGISENLIVYSKDAREAEKLIKDGKYVYTDDPMIIMDIPSIEVVCEGTGVPEASAKYSLEAIKSKKHVVSISKEMDSVVGPILKRKAKEYGVVYTPVDGDQPALLMALVEWAKLIGLTVISAGKARDGEFILDEKNNTVSIKADGITVHEDYVVHILDEDIKYFNKIPEGQSDEYIKKRAELLKGLPNAGAFDLCEMVIVANAIGFKPSCPELTQASLRITELPIAYCTRETNGIYPVTGVIDVHTNLRREDESGMGGGVYMVVKCDNAYSNYILATKGQIPNYDLSTVVIYRPYHLCGVEVATSILSAAFLGVDTGTLEYIPSFDLAKRAERDIMKGELLGNDHDLKLKALILPASKKSHTSPVPGHMITGNRAVRDIKYGEIIDYSMIEDMSGSVLWKLRHEQEETFNLN
ncbi:putative homoserine dehydrogenase-like protein [Youngiibacter multivorans]|uniref:Homoserine dehydrogenase-like protein n=1 Tax=Youngiibacter multivorans TaxID=937251 RepID=A0ABS4G7V9_9CLOT|nr:putative homoserine dehydrogenase-like protein [Youngiibacter multivorans]